MSRSSASDRIREAGAVLASAVAGDEGPAVVLSRLAASGPHPPQVAEVEVALGALRGDGSDVDGGIESDWLFEAVLDAAVRLKRADLLSTALAAEPRHRERAKQLKRAAHQLRSHAVEVPESSVPRHATVGHASAEREESGASGLRSAPDGSGGRLVLLVAAMRGGSSVGIVEAVFRDDTLIRLEAAEVSRKGGRKMIREVRSGLGDTGLDLDPGAGAAEILAAEDAGRLASSSLRAAIAPVRPLLRELERHAKPLAEPAPSADRLPRLLAQSVELLALPLFDTWHPEVAALRDCQEKLHLAAASDLVLNEAQRHEQLSAVFRRAAHEYLTDAHRTALASRLRHMGRFLMASDRGDDAERAWAVALDLEAGGTPAVIEKMFRRVFDRPPSGAEAASAKAVPEPAPASHAGLILPGTPEFHGGGGSAGSKSGLIVP